MQCRQARGQAKRDPGPGCTGKMAEQIARASAVQPVTGQDERAPREEPTALARLAIELLPFDLGRSLPPGQPGAAA